MHATKSEHFVLNEHCKVPLFVGAAVVFEETLVKTSVWLPEVKVLGEVKTV